jgi:hypothetical protein
MEAEREISTNFHRHAAGADGQPLDVLGPAVEFMTYQKVSR